MILNFITILVIFFLIRFSFLRLFIRCSFQCIVIHIVDESVVQNHGCISTFLFLKEILLKVEAVMRIINIQYHESVRIHFRFLRLIY